MAITGKTRICGVIGDPIEHSLSPTMHNAAFKEIGLDLVFLAFKVTPDQVENAVKGVRSLNILGLNVTMPHKNKIISYLDKLDPTAEYLKSANTILNANGLLTGFNTDGTGAMQALLQNGTDPNGKKMLILGSGGAAKAIAFAAARTTDQIVILNRTPNKSQEFAKNLNHTLKTKIEGDALTSQSIEKNMQDAQIIINATSVGMQPHDKISLIPPKLFKQTQTILDIVYNPIETKLLNDAKKAGAKTVNGVEMLIHQGAASFEIWTNKPAPIEAMRKAITNQLMTKGEST
jgi:shikimate dehydrogenase